MRFGHFARAAGHAFKGLGLALALCAVPQVAAATAPGVGTVSGAPASSAPVDKLATPAPAATASAAAAEAASAPAVAAPAAPAIDPNDPHFKVAPGGYVPMKPTEGKGMPVNGGINVQDQYSPNGEVALGLHHWLFWVMVVITLFVLALLVIVAVRFNKRANPTPSKTSHNTLLEVVWTAVPVLILVVIAVPSLRLLAKQYTPAPERAVTVKATGNQWFWTYTYPDNGGIEVISNMLEHDKAIANGEPSQLAVDNRMVVPVGEPIRLQATAADVIHSFAVPSLWFKIDAVPGRINERVMVITEPGVYYGQCSELCGARHGYMPIAVEALPRDKFNAWVIAQGGKIDGAPEAPAAPAAAPAPAPASAAPAADASAAAKPAA
ncbi:cytochrome c oxidase subunit 2 [Novosphingobium kunmingense]|uniref:Cytochrome c oxidase subunit 2 n=1 Tax=Novosphingobium kunmingense TaxID=1211806 RepID=A0A2N0I478_9SPHN|nr:cytochrome c oxidase subunit II [Novosphingobium kunmingense]PKB25983.1 cytochrome c oxidase subunit 2 [Novosphingobium kunmingense]